MARTDYEHDSILTGIETMQRLYRERHNAGITLIVFPEQSGPKGCEPNSADVSGNEKAFIPLSGEK